MNRGKLLIVSNRLPMKIVQDGKKFEIKRSIGGLATGIKAYLNTWTKANPTGDSLWIGWAGGDGIQLSSSIKKKLRHLSCETIDIPNHHTAQRYEHFCNSTLWPLLHCFPDYATYDSEDWDAYQEVNRLFARHIASLIQPGDIIWIQDYHLFLLPKLLRAYCPNVSIGFFLHVPFPAYDLLQLLPKLWREALLDGVVGANLIGFHLQEYQTNFNNCISYRLGLQQNMSSSTINTGVFPMGIDFKAIQMSVNDPMISIEEAHVKSTVSSKKIIFSIDRLDYSKGLLSRLHAYQLFLNQNPQWHNHLIFVFIIAPSRENIYQVAALKHEIDECVGHINSQFSRIDWVPIIYEYRTLSEESLLAHYRVSDVFLVTSLRDGMNLTAKEYLAARTDNQGSLILSETAGAAKELSDALIISPNDIQNIANTIVQALEMPCEERLFRNKRMREHLAHHTIEEWGNTFLKQLTCRVLPSQPLQHIVHGFKRAKKRLLFLDYDGTLCALCNTPAMAIPSQLLLRLLADIATYSNTHVLLISGRDRSFMEEWFKDIPNLLLVAEHGAFLKEPNQSWVMINPLPPQSTSLLHAALPLFKQYNHRLPGSILEIKACSLGLQYRDAVHVDGVEIANDLHDQLIKLTSNTDNFVTNDLYSVELRCLDIRKGAVVSPLIAQYNPDFILAAGDSVTDEDLFIALPSYAISIKIGTGPSHANTRVPTPDDIITLLRTCITD